MAETSLVVSAMTVERQKKVGRQSPMKDPAARCCPAGRYWAAGVF
jgi:hypothetical protein